VPPVLRVLHPRLTPDDFRRYRRDPLFLYKARHATAATITLKICPPSASLVPSLTLNLAPLPRRARPAAPAPPPPAPLPPARTHARTHARARAQAAAVCEPCFLAYADVATPGIAPVPPALAALLAARELEAAAAEGGNAARYAGRLSPLPPAAARAGGGRVRRAVGPDGEEDWGPSRCVRGSEGASACACLPSISV
jgi:hypothetical protein